MPVPSEHNKQDNYDFIQDSARPAYLGSKNECPKEQAMALEDTQIDKPVPGQSPIITSYNDYTDFRNYQHTPGLTRGVY